MIAEIIAGCILGGLYLGLCWMKYRIYRLKRAIRNDIATALDNIEINNQQETQPETQQETQAQEEAEQSE